MARLNRSSRDSSGSIWPGFVDAMTALLIVLMFVLTIFMVIQSMLRDTIAGQEDELSQLNAEMTLLAQALGLEQRRGSELENQIDVLRSTLTDARSQAQEQTALIGSLQTQNEGQAARLVRFEEQVASLIAQRNEALGDIRLRTAKIEDLEQAQAQLISEQEALQLALAQARDEIDATEEKARLAAAQREAFEALIAELRAENAQQAQSLNVVVQKSEQESLANAAALKALRERLANSDDALTAMTLALEQERKRAEETLSLLAAAKVAQEDLQTQNQENLSEAARQAALLALANDALDQEKDVSDQAQRRVALLNAQLTELRRQLSQLQNTLDIRAEKDAHNEVQITALTSQLNTALAQVAAEERRRALLEEAERKRLEAEAKTLENYRSEFFGRLREILKDRAGVQVVGDRFVFSSEVLFDSGSAELGEGGKAQIERVTNLLAEVTQELPAEIDWVIRVDGHTDNIPISGSSDFADNWELSQARALSVVRFMSEDLSFPPERLLAAGFGEHQPLIEGSDPSALAQNRRIVLKLTEK